MKVGDKVEVVSGMFEGHKGVLTALYADGTCDIEDVKGITTKFVETTSVKNHDEAHVVINGTSLSNAQSMTMRVALEHFILYLRTEGLGDDEVGKRITENYIRNAAEARNLMFR